jgi:hypothetical protein
LARDDSQQREVVLAERVAAAAFRRAQHAERARSRHQRRDRKRARGVRACGLTRREARVGRDVRDEQRLAARVRETRDALPDRHRIHLGRRELVADRRHHLQLRGVLVQQHQRRARRP